MIAKIGNRRTKNNSLRAGCCTDFTGFAKTVHALRNIPFCGLDICVETVHGDPCLPLDETAINTVIAKIPLKILRYSADNYEFPKFIFDEPMEDCDALRCLKPLLLASASQVTEISICLGSGLKLRDDLMDNGVNWSFPQLKNFEFRMKWGRSLTDTEIQLFTTAATNSPKLRAFVVFIPSFFEKSELEAQSGSILNFFTAAPAGCRARLVSDIEYPHTLACVPLCWRNHLAVDGFNLVVGGRDGITEDSELAEQEILLENSRCYLETAEVDMFSLAQILLDKASFPKLKRLSIYIDFQYWRNEHPAVLPANLRRFNWQRCFPALNEIFLRQPEPDQLRLPPIFISKLIDMVSNRNTDSSTESEETSCLDVQRPYCSRSLPGFETTEADFFCKLCPNVERLNITCMPSLLPALWGRLVCLKYLTLEIRQSVDLDSVLCGVHPEEVEELKGKDLAYLKTVQIVPTHAPIAYLRGKFSLCPDVSIALWVGYLINCTIP